MNRFEIRGYHVAMIFGLAFSVIIAVNLTLAFQAVRTFPGLEVRNSYVASQSFEAERRAQDALGWQVNAAVADDVLTLRITSQAGAVLPDNLTALLGRPTNVASDLIPAFEPNGDSIVAAVPGLEPGLWTLRIAATAKDGTEFRRNLMIEVVK